MALTHCILGKVLGVGCHCFTPHLDVLTFSARCLHVQRRERHLATESGTLRGQEIFRKISSRIRLPRNFGDLLHATNLRHGTDGFTSPPKEGVLRIFRLKNYFILGQNNITKKTTYSSKNFCQTLRATQKQVRVALLSVIFYQYAW
jgi:hypothetical protein